MAIALSAVAIDASMRRLLQGKGPLTKKDVFKLDQIAAVQKHRKRVGTVKVTV